MKTLVILASVMVVFFMVQPNQVEGQPTAGSIHMGYITTGNVPIPAVGSTKIDPTKVKFLIRIPCRVEYLDEYSNTETAEITVMGIVAKDVELSDDAIAQQLLQMGITFGREQCPPDGEFGERDKKGGLRRRAVSAKLFIGDPTTFTSADIKKFFDGRQRGNGMVPALNQLLDEVYGFWRDNKPELIVNYTNYPKALKLSLAWDAQEARKKAVAFELQRQAEQARQAQIAGRWSAFVKANRVRRFVNGSQFAANPFVYEGQVVAMTCIFVRMNSATQAVFSNGNYSFVVSGIPTTRFTRQGSLVLLAGRVLGNGNLAFVGSVFCQQSGCSDYIQ